MKSFLLAAAEDGSQGPALFALAEAQDLKMLAAWNSQGVAGDVARAQALYRKGVGPWDLCRPWAVLKHSRPALLSPRRNRLPPLRATYWANPR
jgi:hypothetical protein